MNAVLRPPPLPVAHERWALFFDVDGTLVEIEPHPDLVAIAPSTLRLLARASTLLDGAVALLSGRCRVDLDRLTAPMQFPLGAIHGVEWRDATGECRQRATARGLPQRLAAIAAHEIRDKEGVWLEEKAGVAFALHYRAAPFYQRAVLDLAERIADASGGQYAVQLGDCVAELKPAGASKGTALRALMHTPPFTGCRPVVLGDDITDESAFAVAREMFGIAVIVGPRRPTAATHALGSPAVVRAWLADVVACVGREQWE